MFRIFDLLSLIFLHIYEFIEHFLIMLLQVYKNFE